MKSPTLFKTVPPPITYAPLSLDWRFATPAQKNPIANVPGTCKATKFKLCTRIHRLNRNKSPLKISGKVVVGGKFQGQGIHNNYRAHRAVIFTIA